MIRMPEKLTQTIRAVHQERGEAWLKNLPDLLAMCEQRWGLTIKTPFSNLSYNLVLAAEGQDGQGIVMKLSVPNRELANEIKTLAHFEGQGYVRLLGADEDLGVLLLENLRPGNPLSVVEEDEAVQAFIQVMAKQKQHLRPPADRDAFPTLDKWADAFDRLRRNFDGGTGSLPSEMVDKAQQLFADLIRTTEQPVLLHGDLHHDNILSAGEREWAIIDPKGVIGDPCFEPSTFLNNYLLNKPDPASVLAKRVDAICLELGYDRQRVLQWGFAHSMLKATWCIESGFDCWESNRKVAELFERMMA